MGKISRASSWSAVFQLVAAISIVLAAALWLDWLPFLRGGFGWRWPYRPPTGEVLANLLPGLLALLLYGGGLFWLRKRQTSLFLLWVFLGTIAVPTAFLTLFGSPLYILYTRTVSLLTTGGFLKALEFATLGDILRQWPSEMVAPEGIHTHISISPPGWPALFLAVSRLLEQVPALAAAAADPLRQLQCDDLYLFSRSDARLASAWLGILAPLWGALTVFPLYGLGRLLGSESSARRAAAGYALIPAVSLFLGTLNTPYPFLAAAALWLLVKGLQRRTDHPFRGYLYLFGAGVLSTLGLAINFSLVPLLLLCGLVILLHQPLLPASWRRFDLWTTLLNGTMFGAGVLLLMALYWWVTGHHLLQLIPLAMDQHLELNRAYLPWLWLHTWDVILYAGLPLFALFVMALFGAGAGHGRSFTWAVFLTLLIMVLSGTARGETGRVWIFFMPLFLIGATQLLDRLQKREVILLLVAQGVWSMTLLAVIPAVGTGIDRPPTYPEVAPPQLENGQAISVNGTFGQQLKLVNVEVLPQPDTQTVTIDLVWRPLQPQLDSYLFALLAVDPDGEVQAVQEWLPLNYSYPTTCWRAADGNIRDRVSLALPADAPAGAWWFSLSAFALDDEHSPLYLPVALPDGTVDPRQIGFGPVTINSDLQE